MSDPTSPRLFASLKGLGFTLLGVIQTRIELIGVELAEEKERLLGVLLLALGSLLFFALGLLVVTLAIASLFWDTAYRSLALAALAFTYVLLGGWLWSRLRTRLAAHPIPFAATLQQLERDRDAVKAAAQANEAGANSE